MTSPETQTRLPSTFASIRFTADNLVPEAVSSYLRFRPTVSYSKGETYSTGSRGIEQTRRFGLWLFRTETFVFSNLYEDHLDFIVLNFLQRRRDESLKEFLARNNFSMILSIYWYGRKNDHNPDIDDAYTRIIRDSGGKLEAEYDVIEEGEFRAA